MEPEFEGFCRGCNGYSTHLKVRIATNNYTKKMEVGKFCPECIKRFSLYPFSENRLSYTAHKKHPDE